jgi:hypothetical protein
VKRTFILVVLPGLVLFTPTTRAAPADTPATVATPGSGENEPIGKRLTVFSTTALGVPGIDFVNELAGARFELEYTPRFAIGFAASYANLKGKDGRVSNVLPEASFAYRAPLGESAFHVPLRLSGGWLPKNGPTLRFSTGFDIDLGDTFSLELALLEPMVWVAYDRPELSLNLGIGGAGRF